MIADLVRQELDIPADQKRSDFVFVGQEVWVAPIELKRGNVEAKEVIEQLKTGGRSRTVKLFRIWTKNETLFHTQRY